MKQFFYLACFILLMRCTPDHKQHQSHSDSATSFSPKKLPNDTFRVSGKFVVFFSITNLEYTPFANDSTTGIEETLSDFEYYASEASDSLHAQGFQTYFTSSRYICITLDNRTQKVFDRLSGKPSHPTGNIISDGKKMPTLTYGVGTDIDILASLNKFQHP